MKDTNKGIIEKLDDTRREILLKTYHPVFLKQFNSSDYQIPELIRVVEDDKRKQEKYCKDAVGFEDKAHGETYFTMCLRDVERSGLSLFPQAEETFYYKHPFKNMYISLDEYFSYFKKERVEELRRVAQELGAKHVKISLKEHKKTYVSNQKKAGARFTLPLIKVKKIGLDGTVEHDDSSDDFEKIQILLEVDFVGKETPGVPELMYFKDDSNIEGMIRSRHDPHPMNRQVFRLDYNKSSGIKEKDAKKIDAVLDALKCTGESSVTSEVKTEKRTVIELEVVF